MELGRAVASAARRRLGTPMRYLGHLEYDEAVWASTRRRRPLLIEHPETRIAKCFERVARGLHGRARRRRTDGDVLPSDSHYELLEVPPTASFEDIRRANRRIRDIYGAESIAIAGLYDPASLEAVHRRLDLAYTTLMDAAKRKDYDHGAVPRRRADAGRRRRRRTERSRRRRARPRKVDDSGDARDAPADARDHARAPSSRARCCARSARRSASSCARSPRSRRSAWRTCRRSRARCSRSCRRRCTCAASSRSTRARSASTPSASNRRTSSAIAPRAAVAGRRR